MSFREKDKKESPKNPAERYKRFLDVHLCTFRTAGRRCQMLGDHIDHGSEYRLCGWHWLNQGTPDMLQNYEEFVRYRDMDRKTYTKEWLQASLYVDDKIVWACILGKEQRREFTRALRTIENECDEEIFGNPRHKGTIDYPPTPEVSVKKYAESLPF